MIDLLKQVESVPVAFPDTPGGLSDNATALDSNMIWSRIETYVSHRWTEREVVWTIEGHEDDDWTAPLTPVVSLAAEKWESGSWVSVTLPEGPMGYCLPSDGQFRITAQVGGGSVPAAVPEAYRRLAEYLSGAKDSLNEPGASSISQTITSDLQWSVTRAPNWIARAIQHSGAADLLRPYRRA